MKIISIIIKERILHVSTCNGQKVTCNLDNYPRLKKAINQELQNYTIASLGIHSKECDEHLMFEIMKKITNI
ncbi:MAG: DUF2442 domain-containing protein [Chitinophagaceae bacterium]